ncbi:SLATT domain-containing protein [Vibrio hangzhouensis]|uniref:SLATT domain-containing protein n=1 Tax=Vibrio hangzhouensis TaxID=462991 RepID=UPI001C957255|nr:SLATT domain-containing protein [Vibrio hangzhouensis]MBY6196858.1 SLATT domain-containing protein [Vibrio hangzhouensis]
MKLNDYLESLKQLTLFKDNEHKGSYDYLVNWYAVRHPKHRRYYYVSSFLVVILSFTLAIVIAIGIDDVSKLRGIGSALLALVTSVSSVFVFKQSWSGYFIAEQKLMAIKDVYDEALLRAKLIESEDSEKALKIAVEATKQFMLGTSEIVTHETMGYFASLKSPGPH